jgi:hypothetical protein
VSKTAEETKSATLRRILRRRRLASVRKSIIASALLAALLVAYCSVSRLPYPISELSQFAATDETAPAAADVAAASPDRVVTAPVARPTISVSESDPFVRQLTLGLSTDPAFSAWLQNESLIRIAVACIANLAEGVSPRKQVEFLAPATAFQVVTRDERTFFAPDNGSRYDHVADVFTSLDVGTVAFVYQRLRPLLFVAYEDLGFPHSNFEDALRIALDELWDTPLQGGEIELIPFGMSYQYTDPELESMSGAQKLFFRMGLRNQRRIRIQLGELARASGVADMEAPAEGLSASFSE